MVFNRGKDKDEEHLEENEDGFDQNEGSDDLQLSEELSKKDAEIEELTLKLTRMQADYNNLKRRTDMEKKGSVDFGIETLAMQLLPVLDNFERALEAENDKEAGFYQGINMIYTQLIDILKCMNIEEIDALNCPFDPNMHNAIMVEESEEHEEGIVTGILQKGYQFKDKVIRPTMVKVSK